MKDLIIQNLRTLRSDCQAFKRKFYDSAIVAIENMQLVEIMERRNFADINGIGKKISEKIIQIRDTGANLEEVDKIDAGNSAQGFDIGLIFGIGPTKKHNLIESYGPFRDIQHFDESDKKQDFLTSAQRIGVKFFSDIQQPIPRVEMRQHEQLIQQKKNELISFNITGSYRRGAQSSGDIDVLIHTTVNGSTEVALNDFVASLKSAGYIKADLAFGKSKYMGIAKLPDSLVSRRIDIMITGSDEYYFSLLYFTGSDEFNKDMRSYALEKGYSLNEKGIKDVKSGSLVRGVFDSERAIFTFLGLEFVAPHKRTKGAVRSIVG